MSIPITIPRLGWNMEEGTFIEWRKRDGDTIRPGDVLYVLESEKAAEEIETLDGGILGIAADGPRPGDKVKVGQVIAHLLAQGEALPIAAARPPALQPTGQDQCPAARVPPAASPSVRLLARQLGVDLAQLAVSSAGPINDAKVRSSDLSSPAGMASRPTSPMSRQRVAISPRARRVARELGVDWNGLPGSGRNARIRERDIRAAVSQVAAGRIIPHTAVRKAIAARMIAGITQAAPVTLHARAEAGELVRRRRRLKTATSPGDPVPTYADMLLQIVAVALSSQPLMQAQWRDNGLLVPERIDIAFAVDTEHGLFAPVIRNADRLSLCEVARQALALMERASAGKLSGDDMRDATFTITNLGMHGVEEFTPIITPPQCAVLGIGKISRVPAVVGDAVVPRDQVVLSLAFDHRIVDGAPAARFLDSICAMVATSKTRDRDGS
ncbi:MAG: 2-oxo acid dehydrogenase subunit E2 [Planctomycetes bacterium]|nr:2-oxo acid dehydrogenase subunit E2 [Planctomycetota bacterium]